MRFSERRTDRRAVRTQVYHGELTPASSGHNSLNSPVSAGSGPKVPWPTVSKWSIPGPRRPATPEPINLDCAFPPFPLPARATTTNKRDRAATQRSEAITSRSRDVHKSSGRPALTRQGSSNTSGIESSDTVYTLKQSRPTSPLNNEVKLESHQEPTKQLPDVPILSSDTLMTIASPAPAVPVTSPGLSPSPLTRSAQPRTPSDQRFDPGLSAFDFGNSTTTQSAPRSVEPSLNGRARADTEPAYKLKRPPPILSRQEILPLAKSATTVPQPSSSGSFGRSFGRLFSRRLSQSTSSRREVALQALSDGPDSLDTSFASQSILSPYCERSFFSIESSPLATSPFAMPETLQDHEQSLKALEGLTPENAVVVPPVVVVEPAINSLGTSGLAFPFTLDATEPPKLAETLQDASTTDGGELIEALRRISIDSASSYGSIGFSERTTSSRSTAPHMERMPIDLVTSRDSTLIEIADVDVPAPLRPKIPELPPDSPTDPLFQEGCLSPIPSTHRPQGPLDSLHSTHLERETSPDLVRQLHPSSGDTVKPLAPNKGVCRGCAEHIFAGQKSVSSADGRLTGRYHKKCFVCHACKTSFPTAEFYVHNDQPYCAYHYHELENSLCATCGTGIEGLYTETTNVAGRGKEKHHPECLKCTTCRVRLDHDYFELSGKVYCERDAFRIASAPKSHDNAPSRPSPLIRECICSGAPGLVKGTNFPERRITKLIMNMI